MTCEDVRDLLPEHLLGSLDETTDARIRKHLRGCAECRAERMRLEDGVAALSHATHDQDPPEELRQHVLDVLADEWDEPEALPAPPRAPAAGGSAWRWLAVAAAIVLVSVSLSWGVSQSRRAAGLQADAGSYQALLDTLGGKEFRLGELQPADGQAVKGTVVLYDGEPGKDWNSWGIVMANAPDFSGEAHVRLVAENGDSMEMPSLRFENGEAATWLVTHENLTPYNELVITAPDGSVLATAPIAAA
ncbi:MAG: zf-HC2 domain-containing protein [Actinomycetota bacterium]